MRGLLVASLLAALISIPAAAAAQCEAEPEPNASTRAAARPHYRAGIEASRNERWMQAREEFRRAADIVPLSPILYNLATAQAETGAIVEAAENYRTFLRRCVSRQTPELRAEAEQLLAGLTPRVGRIILRVDNIAAEVDQVTIDGSPITLALLGTEMPANPGAHEIRITRRSEELATRLVDIREGQTATVSLSLDAYEPSSSDDGGGGGGGGDDTALIVGLTIGGAVLLAGAATLIAILVVGTQGSVDLPVGTWGTPAQVPLIEF